MRLFPLFFTAALLSAQAPRGPQVTSPEVAPDRTVTFRLLAPNASEVRLSNGDIPGGPRPMVKNDAGVWEVTLGPLVPGAYRYAFNVEGVRTVDPRNPMNSESNEDVWSMFVVPGSEMFDTREVPHGAVAEITYPSKALGRARRMHVYTPPGYESGKGRFPVFYLLHGASDTDDAWTSVGRAGFVLDNLIAARKAKPMIVVMPAGHTQRGGVRAAGQADEFIRDFREDIVPYVESHYRTKNGRANRAIAGLSMGGSQTMNIVSKDLGRYAYIGVYSSAIRNRPGGPDWEKDNAATLDNAALKKGLKLFWIGVGKEDAVLPATRTTVEMFKRHGFTVEAVESGGGHTWLNWRDYLVTFAPRLFQ